MKKNRKKQKQAPLWPLLLMALMLIFAGAGVFFYPTVANYMAEQNQATVVESYVNKSADTDYRDLSEEWEKARTYNSNLSGNPVQFPFVPGTGYVLPQNYLEVLNLNGDGVMGIISIPKIHVNMPIYHGCDEEALQKGAGHIEQTFLPIGGESTHSVISGHRGLPHAEMFSRLDELEAGDIFVITVMDEHFAYEVDQISVVLPENLENIRAVPGENLVTLVTCTPYGVNTHRLLVRGHRTEYVSETMKANDSGVHIVYHGMDKDLQKKGAVMGAVFLLAVGLILFVPRKGKRK